MNKLNQYHKLSYELSDNEKLESGAYVCYERSLYHLFKRNHRIENFAWLYLDRFFGFEYSENNEPIKAIQNGFQDFIETLQVYQQIKPEELKETLRLMSDKGYVANGMMRFERPSGECYYSNALFEIVEDEVVYFTRTHTATSRTLKAIDYNELTNRLVKDQNCIELWFIKISSEIVDALRANGRKLLKTILLKLYGYRLKNDEVIYKNQIVQVTTFGLDSLLNEYNNQKNQLLDQEITKRDQLRMHKHIQNKIEPQLIGWTSILSVPEVVSDIGEVTVNEVMLLIEKLHHGLSEMLKWVGLIVARRDKRFMDAYLNQLSQLTSTYKALQLELYEIFKVLLEMED